MLKTFGIDIKHKKNTSKVHPSIATENCPVTNASLPEKQNLHQIDHTEDITNCVTADPNFMTTEEIDTKIICLGKNIFNYNYL